MRIAELIELLASTTWRTIARASRNRISFGEDAITSINLNAIASSNYGSVAVEDARVDEAHKGCDFEMWIGGDRDGWLRYAVQAKKISAASGRYENLGHEVRGRSQIEILNDYAKRVRAVPLYCFYNFAPRVTAWNCALPNDEQQLGCMVTPAVVVDQAICMRGCRNFDWMHRQPETIPWRCLLTCSGGHRDKHSTCATARWPEPRSHLYERLPHELEVLRTRRGELGLIEARTATLDDERLYPRWTIILDRDGHQ